MSEQQNKNTKTSSKGKPLNLARLALWICVAFFICTLMLIAPMLINGVDHDAMIRIPANATIDQVEDSVAKYYGPTFASRVRRLMNVRGTDLARRHGAYRIRKGDTPFMAMRRLTSGGREPIRVTINGFRSIDELTNRLSLRMEFTADSLRKVLNDSVLMARYGLTRKQSLSLFIEDTYETYWSSSPLNIVERIGHHYMTVWNGRRRALAAKLNLTPSEVMTLASIVDEETNKLDEKGKIARVYINRLQSGMKLQADPTVRYAMGDFSIQRITGNHLEIESPYNTYIHYGLPPGPIRTTGTATIDAILSSEPTDDIYMCAREDMSGYHNFASNYEQHLENARRYQKELNRRGIH